MKRKILLTAILTVLFACLLVIGISAAGQSYSSYTVTLTDGTVKTAYTAGVDQWEGRVCLKEKVYAEPPLDTDGTYEELDWTTVKELDFSNAMLYVYDENKKVHVEKAYGSNQSGTALCIIHDGINRATQLVNLEKVITGKAVTLREGTFNGCANLKTLVISSNLKYIQNNVFYNCPSLEEIIFEGTSKLETVSDSFYGCTALKELTIPASMTKLSGNSFRDCTSLEKVVFENGCKVEIGSATFYGCSNLTSVTLSEGITKLGSSAFGYCTSLESIHVPASVTEIGSNCFEGCKMLSSITFEMENSQLTKAGAHSFQETAIKEIVFPNSFLRIGQSAFNKCSNLETINFGASFVDFNANNAGQPPMPNISTLKYVYLPSTFDGVRNCIFSWNDNNANEYNKIYTNLTFFYTGTKEQAQAIINKAATGGADGAVLNTYIATMTLISAEDYAASVENGTLVEGVSGAPARYMVYGYNKCEAFYGGEHKLSENAVQKFENEAYTSRYISVCACTRGCGSDAITELCAPLFVNKGYSREIDGTFFDYGFVANKEAIALYEEITGEKLSYGIIAANKSISADGALFNENGEAIDGAIAMSFEGTDYNAYSVKVTGINKEEYKDRGLYCSAYVIDSSSISYIGNTVTELASLISYNQIKAPDTEE